MQQDTVSQSHIFQPERAGSNVWPYLATWNDPYQFSALSFNGSLLTCCALAVQLASAYGKLGNIDANTGDAQTGWDTDQFLTDPKEATLVAAVILKQAGLAPGAPPKLN